MKKILQLTTYDIDEADHGGKLRCLNIRRALSTFFDVKTMSIEVSENESIDGMKYNLDRERFYSFGGNKYLIDLYINNYIGSNDYILRDIEEKFIAFDPDIVIFEQPYLWPVFKDIVKNYKKEIFIVNSTQNIESELKQEIYSSRFLEPQASLLLNEVSNMEIELAKESNMSISVSEKDYDYIRGINPEIPSFIFGNGSSKPKLNPNFGKWNDIFKGTSGYNLVFVGSAHPPNIDGLKELFIECNKFEGFSHCDLWILGGVGDFIRDDKEMINVMPPWVHIIGSQTGEDIDSAILASDGVILPIWHGGGSNLKTAQAILSGKFILASDYAFRGFEKYKYLERATVMKSSSDIATWLARTPVLYENVVLKDTTEVGSLAWEGILRELPNILELNHQKWIA